MACLPYNKKFVRDFLNRLTEEQVLLWQHSIRSVLQVFKQKKSFLFVTSTLTRLNKHNRENPGV